MAFLTACSNTTPPTTITKFPSTSSLIAEQTQYQKKARGAYNPPGPASDPWGPYIREASKRFDVPTVWIRAIMHQESGGRIYDSKGNFITSLPGAMGLMQIMPPSYDELSSEYGLGSDAYNPHDNIMAGTAYIRQMYDIYGSPGFLAAYNYGPGSIDRYLHQNKALPLETRRYVSAIAPKIVGFWPKNRSDNDLIVARLDPTARTYSKAIPSPSAPPILPTSPIHQSVSSTWASRGFAATPVPTPSPTRIPPSHPSLPKPRNSDETIHIQSIPLAHPTPHYNHVSDITTSTRRNWHLQLGSYTTSPQALSIVHLAHTLVGSTVQQGVNRTFPIQVKGKKLYRAQIMQLTHSQSLSACQRLAYKIPCVPLSSSSKF